MSQIMTSFAEMRNYAKKVDEGIEYLENRVRNPQAMNLVTTQSACIAESTLLSIFNDVTSMKERIESHILEERAENQDLKEICYEVEEFAKEIEEDLDGIEADLIPFGYVPFCKENNEISAITSSMGDSSRKVDRKLFLEETPVFSSPNYNSTPDSASYKRSDRVRSVRDSPKLMQHMVGNLKNDNMLDVLRSGKSGYNSNMNYTLLRNYSPPPFFPSSVKHKSTVNNPMETMFSSYKSRNHY